MSKPIVSVIVCTHNPRVDYLRRVLDALKAQTLPKEQWELLLIDNGSKEPLAGKWDLSWHPHARHICEEELGLTLARFRGIREAAAQVLVFVDDDNVLSPDYLSSALGLTRSHSWVGAFGGNIVGEFEVQPEKLAEFMLPYLALISVTHEEWALGNGTSAQFCAPCGAGMVLRKAVADHYLKMSDNDPLRRGLDRKGASLVSAGDVDMALCSCVLGMAVGRFPQLQMTHLIPKRRLERDYILQLAEGTAFSNTILQYIWKGVLPGQNQTSLSRSQKILRACRVFRNRLRATPQSTFNDEFRKALDHGVLRACEVLRSKQPASKNNGVGVKF